MVSHTGTVGGFSSLLTLFPDLELGIFTNVNGPMAPHSDNFLQALHMYAVDVIMEEDPWLDVTPGNNVTQGTACTYPLPWAVEGPSVQTLDTLKNINHQPRKSERGKAQKLPEEEYEAYLGTYGHHLLGDTVIYYNSTADEMWGTAGRIGLVRLIPTQDSHIFDFEFEGALWYLSELGPPMPPIVFQNLQDDVYHELVVEAIDPQVPPVFVRDQAWEDVPPPPQYPECDYGTAAPRLTGSWARYRHVTSWPRTVQKGTNQDSGLNGISFYHEGVKIIHALMTTNMVSIFSWISLSFESLRELYLLPECTR